MWKSLLIAVTLAGTPPAGGPAVKEQRPGLLARAKVRPEAARATALSRVPGGVVREAELEEEHGKLVYSFDITVAGRTGVEEVQVDAMKGTVASVEHEAPTDEAAEKKAEQRPPSREAR